MSIRRRTLMVIAAFAAFAAAVIIWAPTVGTTSISLARAFDRRVPWDANIDAQIFFVARLPRAGAWMLQVKRFFALVMLGVAEYYLIEMGKLLF